jgi:ribosomal protein S27AE
MLTFYPPGLVAGASRPRHALAHVVEPDVAAVWNLSIGRWARHRRTPSERLAVWRDLALRGQHVRRATNPVVRKEVSCTGWWQEDHLESFLEQAARLRDGDGLPPFVERAFREFLRCGFLAGGSARFHCGDCGLDRLVAFSCKGRALCSSCGGRRMAERAAHLVDHVIPDVPVRQWVLSLPHPAAVPSSNRLPDRARLSWRWCWCHNRRILGGALSIGAVGGRSIGAVPGGSGLRPGVPLTGTRA